MGRNFVPGATLLSEALSQPFLIFLESFDAEWPILKKFWKINNSKFGDPSRNEIHITILRIRAWPISLISFGSGKRRQILSIRIHTQMGNNLRNNYFILLFFYLYWKELHCILNNGNTNKCKRILKQQKLQKNKFSFFKQWRIRESKNWGIVFGLIFWLTIFCKIFSKFLNTVR